MCTRMLVIVSVPGGLDCKDTGRLLTVLGDAFRSNGIEGTVETISVVASPANPSEVFPNKLLAQSLHSLGFSVRIHNTLRDSLKVRTVLELVRCTQEALAAEKRIGPKGVEIVQTALRNLHPELHLGMKL